MAADGAGSAYLTDLAAEGVDSNARDSVTRQGESGRCLVLITPDAERTMATFLGVAGELTEDDIDACALANSRHIYLEGYLCTSDSARAAAIRARELAGLAGVQVTASLSDPSIVANCAPLLREMLGDRVDHLFCNVEEAQAWTQTSSLSDAALALRDYAGSYSITCGDRGCLVWDGATEREQHLPGVPVQTVDTLGAGDLYAGAYLYHLCRCKQGSHLAAAEFANRAAAQLVTRMGPRLPRQALQSLAEGLHQARPQ